MWGGVVLFCCSGRRIFIHTWWTRDVRGESCAQNAGRAARNSVHVLSNTAAPDAGRLNAGEQSEPEDGRGGCDGVHEHGRDPHVNAARGVPDQVAHGHGYEHSETFCRARSAARAMSQQRHVQRQEKERWIDVDLAISASQLLLTDLVPAAHAVGERPGDDGTAYTAGESQREKCMV